MPRVTNRSKEEKLELLNLIKANYHILGEKISDKESAETKRRKWEEIFNHCAHVGHEWTRDRDAQWLARTKWPGIARDAKEKYDVSRSDKSGKIRLTDLDQLVMDILLSYPLQSMAKENNITHNGFKHENIANLPSSSSTLQDLDEHTHNAKNGHQIVSTGTTGRKSFRKKTFLRTSKLATVLNSQESLADTKSLTENDYSKTKDVIYLTTHNVKNVNGSTNGIKIPQTTIASSNCSSEFAIVPAPSTGMKSSTDVVDHSNVLQITTDESILMERRLKYLDSAIELNNALTYESQLRSIIMEQQMDITPSRFPHILTSTINNSTAMSVTTSAPLRIVRTTVPMTVLQPSQLNPTNIMVDGHLVAPNSIALQRNVPHLVTTTANIGLTNDTLNNNHNSNPNNSNNTYWKTSAPNSIIQTHNVCNQSSFS